MNKYDVIDTKDTIGKSKFKTNLKKPLNLFGMVEDLRYRILNVDIDTFKDDKDPPKVGEIIHLEHDYKSDDIYGYRGWDRLELFIGRNTPSGGIHNWVRYYDTVEDLETVLKGLRLELASDLADKWIADLTLKTKRRIKELKKDYHI